MSIARFAAAAAISSSFLLAACESGLPNPYRTVTGWMAAPEGRVLGSMSMVDVAPDGTLWIAERCGANDCLPAGDLDPILHVGADGEWLGAFGAGLFAWPHGIYVDAGGNVWVTDARGGEDRGHQVIKFAPDGRELLRLGTSAHAGDGPTHFNGPTDVVVAPNGDVFVSDGHEPVSNNRIVKFAADGRYHQGVGRNGQRAGTVPRAARARARFAGPIVRRRSRQQPHPDLRSGRQLLGASGRSSAGRAAFTSRPTTRSTSRTTNRTTNAIRAGRAASTSAARRTAR